MLLYMVNFIHAFISLSLITGMLIAKCAPGYGKKIFRSLIISLAAGLIFGASAYFVSIRQEAVTSTRTFLYAAGIAAAALNSGMLLLHKKQGRALSAIGQGTAVSFTAALSSLAAFSFFSFITEHALSASTVLNTDLILNISGILAGAFIIAFLIPLTNRISFKNSAAFLLIFLLCASGLLIVKWSAEVLLGLMRLEMIEVTSLRLSFVAKTAKYAYAFPYIYVFILSILSFVFFSRRMALVSHCLPDMKKAERRKISSTILLEMRWAKSALASVLIVFSVLLYHDLYASRPPKISNPLNIKPDADGLIKIKIEDVKDGRLHRYSYITDDGHVVRFFMLNRSKTQDRIGVVYDACMLCGDMGYIQEKNEVICIACNVRIFVPSIGKAGGCNPIPLAHKVEGGYIVVSEEELDKGAKYFSEVVSIKVKDPVTGKELNNLKAPHRYEYNGRIYFFESAESWEKFKASPETYAGNRQARYFRVQGYQ